jgi:hypothetical protein
MRAVGELTAGAVQRIAAFDADRLHVDQHSTRSARRVGHVLVAKYFWTTGLVVHRRLHDLPSGARA